MAKQKMYAFVKIGGFAIGIAACFLIALFIRDELSYDQDIVNKDDIFRVLNDELADGDWEKYVWMPAPFANVVKNEYPEVEKIGRFLNSELFGAGPNQIRRVDKLQNVYEERFVYIDQDLLEIWGSKWLQGDPEHALDDPNSLVITKSKADKFFPGENALGRAMIISDDVAKPRKITGVIADFPKNFHVNFDFFMTIAGVVFYEGEQMNWLATNYHTYVRLKKGTDLVKFESKLSDITRKYYIPQKKASGQQVDENKIASEHRYKLQPISEIYLGSADVGDGLSHGDMRFIWLFGSVAGFILLLACINFVNLSTAKSANRAIEVGLRKTVGSERSGLVNQFLTESLLISFISISLGVVLAWLLLPLFNTLAAKSLVFPITAWWLAPLLVISSLVIGIVAGLYPAFYLSGFKPIQILKGQLSRGSKGSGIRSSLVVFQFTTSIILIIGTFVIYRQVNFILNAKVGYDRDQIVLIHGAGTLDKKIDTFKDEIKKLPQVKNASVSDYLPIKGTKRNGNGFWQFGKTKENASVSGQFWVADENYIETLGIKLIAGRNFSRDRTTDAKAVIINQKLAKDLNLKDPVGKHITNWSNSGNDLEVIGVVEDFHYESLKENIEGLCIQLGISPGIVSVKVNTSDMKGALKSITDVWNSQAPNQPIRYTFMDQSFAQMYDDVNRMGLIFTSFAVLAIIVACLGLFALSAFMVEQRSKEISIRKVLGASVRSILSLLTGNFLMLVLISAVIASPIGWYMMQEWLQDYEYKITITWDIFVFAGLVAGFVAIVTISFQAIRAALIDPAKGLRSE
ncbi:ABC transporter permease [Dyadobacter pollutisoli]|uniref:ABC transporter permease n=1 Tax=Dyadobacter pollutisoli TaxID=2910158 RepID=A0A9E8SIT8_9BACT|nr:ABC transporter permease [Dyadobacter pollutisoli]WAC10590.1 ABC transporter permease [Dyadobacter pollutisoli]